MFKKAADNYSQALDFFQDLYKTQEMFIKTVDNYFFAKKYVSDKIGLTKCVLELLKLALLYLILFPIDIRPKGSMMKLLMIFYQQ